MCSWSDGVKSRSAICVRPRLRREQADQVGRPGDRGANSSGAFEVDTSVRGPDVTGEQPRASLWSEGAHAMMAVANQRVDGERWRPVGRRPPRAAVDEPSGSGSQLDGAAVVANRFLDLTAGGDELRTSTSLIRGSPGSILSTLSAASQQLRQASLYSNVTIVGGVQRFNCGSPAL